MKSICVVAYTNYLTDARVIRIAESAQRAGFKVSVFALKEPGTPNNEIIDDIVLFRLPILKYYGHNRFRYLFSYMSFFVLCLLYFCCHYFQYRYSVIYVNNMPDFLVFSTILCKLMGSKIVLDIHDSMPEIWLAKYGNKRGGFFYRILRLQERISALYANRIVTVHELIKEDILAKNGINPEKITVITNFADGTLFKPSAYCPFHGPLRLIYYGTISERFDLENIVHCIGSLKAKDALSLKIIGKGDLQAKLRYAIDCQGLANYIQYEERTYPLHVIANILKHYHLGLVPYKLTRATDYMLPAKMLELTAAGIPVITISNAAIRYYFESTMYFQYDPSDMNSLLELLEDLIAHPELILEKREAILSRRDDFLCNKEHGKFVSFLTNLTRRGSNETN